MCRSTAIIALLLPVASLMGCSEREASDSGASRAASEQYVIQPASISTASSPLYDAASAVRPPAGYPTFSGYACTDDCSGHQAGYDWAEDNDITDETDCAGNSDSFNEGCTARVEEYEEAERLKEEEQDEADEDSEDDE